MKQVSNIMDRESIQQSKIMDSIIGIIMWLLVSFLYILACVGDFFIFIARKFYKFLEYIGFIDFIAPVFFIFIPFFLWLDRKERDEGMIE